MTNIRKSHMDDKELMDLVYQWQNTPQKYNSLLLEQVYPTLLAICAKQAQTEFNQEKVQASLYSLVNEAYIRLQQTKCKTPVESLREFNVLLGGIVRSIMLDRYKKANAIKRKAEHDPMLSPALADENPVTGFKADFDTLDRCLVKLKLIEPDVAEALSLRVYNAKTNEQTAFIMNKSVSTIEKLIKEGRKMLNALVHGVELAA
jgi:DNA-directed RNA polymerase specialized sigma24 family protein